jgi:hypothetical protein
MPMKKITALVPLVLLAAAGPASAQAPGSAPAPTADPAPAPRADGWEGHQTSWGIGLRTVGKSLAAKGDDDRDDAVDMGGGGLTVRYRLNRRWELDLALESAEGELADGLVTRTSGGATLAALYHMRPDRNWDWYVLAGLGGSEERLSREGKGGEMIEESFSQAHVHLGVGLERRFRRFGIGAELRAIGAALNTEEGDAPAYMEGQTPIPEESSGGQLNITATYYF